MFCPECEFEYKPGITVCPDCEVELVEELSLEDIEHEFQHSYVEILKSMNQGDLSVIQSLFDSNDIDYLFSDENFNSVTPLIQPVKVLVYNDEVEDALELLKGMDLHLLALSTKSKSSDSE